jgi:O-antigen/teichoic acid export membrane protein
MKQNILLMVQGLLSGKRLNELVVRIRTSAVVWSWAFNGMRLASAVFLLPLLVSKLSKPEFGMYYVFLSVIGLQTFLDLGFSATIARFVSYAMAGAKEIKAQGYAPSSADSSGPNRELLWLLLRTTRRLYLYIALLGFVVMAAWGSLLVMRSVSETPNPSITWLAWGLTLTSAVYDLYSIWWNNFLYGLNRVRESARIGFLTYTLRLVIACVLLLLGFGLVSVPAAALVGAVTNRFFARRAVLRALGDPVEPAGPERSLLSVMWPNSWRLAVQMLSVYLRTNAFTQICLIFFGLGVTGQYGLSIQILAHISTGMAMVWTTVKWPHAAQLRSKQDTPALRKLLWPRFWLMVGTFVLLSAAAILVGPMLLELLKSDKQMLSSGLLLLVALYAILDLHYVFWSTLLAMENRIPTLWTAVVTNVISLLLGIALSTTSLGIAGLVIAPLISGSVFLYWYWPAIGARSLDTTWTRFILRRWI